MNTSPSGHDHDVSLSLIKHQMAGWTLKPKPQSLKTQASGSFYRKSSRLCYLLYLIFLNPSIKPSFFLQVTQVHLVFHCMSKNFSNPALRYLKNLDTP